MNCLSQGISPFATIFQKLSATDASKCGKGLINSPTDTLEADNYYYRRPSFCLRKFGGGNPTQDRVTINSITTCFIHYNYNDIIPYREAIYCNAVLCGVFPNFLKRKSFFIIFVYEVMNHLERLFVVA